MICMELHSDDVVHCLSQGSRTCLLEICIPNVEILTLFRSTRHYTFIDHECFLPSQLQTLPTLLSSYFFMFVYIFFMFLTAECALTLYTLRLH